MALHHIVFLSSVRPEYSKGDLLCLLRENRKRNDAAEITGILIYKDGSILQVLEGEKEAVHAAYAETAADSRFRGVFPVIHGPLKNRKFTEWRMAFRDSKINPEKIEGFSNLMNSPHPNHQIGIEPSPVRTFLESFVRPRHRVAA